MRQPAIISPGAIQQQKRREIEAELGILGQGCNNFTRCESCVNSGSVHTNCRGKNYVNDPRISHSVAFITGMAFGAGRVKAASKGKR